MHLQCKKAMFYYTFDLVHFCTCKTVIGLMNYRANIKVLSCKRASPGAAVKLCLGDLLFMGSNPETASLHMQG